MKRDRDDFEDDEKPQIGPSRTPYRISPDTTTSSYPNTTTNQNPYTSKNTTNNNNNNNSNNKEQDRFLPIANVGRIMKRVMPANGKISKDAKETVQECVSEFISFVTGEASDKCQREKRKTINGDDILWAITTLGFEEYVHPLKKYLAKYREIEGEKLNVPKQQRVEQRMQHDQNSSNHLPYNSVYSAANLISPPPFVSADPPFPLPFSQNSIQTAALPQHDRVDDHW
ncbi:nuclear transcription factor Y subunit B-3-like [Salvia miltiorrhiza]|uniref:nuclear transcription factor Y subunit B-3-like n=1 Tax=Salvia miltiorrhiza TaxID=226208 RepID=UPI0025ACA21D|nr:nuclear transcription factor Y subunit B-3-like [Salvia miltiorrhiza]